MRICDIICELEKIAPPHLAESWDNSGFLLGDEEKSVSKIFVCLEVNSQTLAQAIAGGAELIVSHHPLIFKPLSHITESDPTGRLVRALIRNDIALYSMHTTFDKADGGMNDLLAQKIGLENVRKYTDEECASDENIGRLGLLDPPMSLEDFAAFVRAALGSKNLRTIGNPEEEISTVALCTGSGGDLILNAFRAGADVYLTGDIGHHDAQLASEIGLNVIDAGHFETENIICPFLEEFFADAFPDLDVFSAAAESYFN